LKGIVSRDLVTFTVTHCLMDNLSFVKLYAYLHMSLLSRCVSCSFPFFDGSVCFVLTFKMPQENFSRSYFDYYPAL
jgi:hypothetical protein